MKLSSQLLLGVVGITVLSQLILGVIAYWIVVDADRNHVLEHLHSRASELGQAVAIPLATGEEPSAALAQSLRYFAPSIEFAAILDRDGVAGVADRTAEHDGGRQLADTLLAALPLGSDEWGEIDLRGQNFFWLLAPVEGLPYRLLILDRHGREKGSLIATLHSRFLASGLIILWVAVWVALLLASVITRKLDEKSLALRHQVTHDALTGLPNRDLLYERISEAIEICGDAESCMALMFLEVKRFTDINETLGHDFGDHLLLEVSARISHALPPDATLARLGDSRFALLIIGADEQQAIEQARVMLRALHEPIDISHVELEVALCTGIALYPQHAEDASSLMRHADVAMHQAAARGTCFQVYDDKDNKHSIRRLSLTADLRKAIAGGQLVLYYQPKLSLRSGTISGLEALVRWEHPTLGMVPPDEFIGLAEQTGAIGPLTDWVLEEALYYLRRLQSKGARLDVAVNISTQILRDAQLKPRIVELLALTGIEGRCLSLEITESVLMHDISFAQNELNALHELGMRISIDDFGTGFSSLAYLNRLPVDELKVDRSFVLGMADSANDQAIVQSIVQLAHTLGCTVVAEGIEDRESLVALENMGCDTIQGYYISAPLPGDIMEQWLEEKGVFAGPQPAAVEERAAILRG